MQATGASCAIAEGQVLALGYSVGRVEEMPAEACTDPASLPGGIHPSKLMVRRLVKIYTPGMSVEGLDVVRACVC